MIKNFSEKYRFSIVSTIALLPSYAKIQLIYNFLISIVFIKIVLLITVSTLILSKTHYNLLLEHSPSNYATTQKIPARLPRPTKSDWSDVPRRSLLFGISTTRRDQETSGWERATPCQSPLVPSQSASEGK